MSKSILKDQMQQNTGRRVQPCKLSWCQHGDGSQCLWCYEFILKSHLGKIKLGKINLFLVKRIKQSNIKTKFDLLYLIPPVDISGS